MSLPILRGPEASQPRHEFRSTGDPEAFSVLAQRFLGPEVAAVERITPAAYAAGDLGPPDAPSLPVISQGLA